MALPNQSEGMTCDIMICWWVCFVFSSCTGLLAVGGGFDHRPWHSYFHCLLPVDGYAVCDLKRL